MISFDPPRAHAGCRSVLALCVCGWRQLAGDHAEADRAAMRHLDVAHPDPSLERAAALKANRYRDTRR